MGKPVVTTEPEQRARGNRRLIVGLIVGAVIGWLYAQGPAFVDYRAHRFCQWPRHEGEGMTVIVRGGKVECYELNR